MAHFVYKKPLQNEKLREQYLGDRSTLRRARDAGKIDNKSYKEAKRQILPTIPADIDPSFSFSGPPTRAMSIASSSGSRSPPISIIPPVPPIPSFGAQPSPKAKKGSIFDRNNLALRLYKPDAQTQQQRELKKEQKKAQPQEPEEHKPNGTPHLDGFGTSGDFKRHYGSVSDSSASSGASTKGRSRSLFGIFPKHPRRSPPPVPQHSPLLAPRHKSDIEHPMDPLSRCVSAAPDSGSSLPVLSSEAEEAWPPQILPSSTGSSRDSRPRKASAITLQSTTTTNPTDDETVPTWADRLIFGVKEVVPESSFLHLVPGPRRHSFCSSHVTTERAQRSNTASIYSRQDRWEDEHELPYGLSNGNDGEEYTPPSMLLLDLFSPLIAEFESTPQIFSYVMEEEEAYSRSAGPECADPKRPHPGHLVVLDDELEDLERTLKKRIWFLMAVKWLYFGRILFSPGHHLLHLTGDKMNGPRPGEELRILDLDGPAVADWAWHAAQTYPDSFIYVITACDSTINTPTSPLFSEFASPPNQRRVQIPAGHSSLQPLATGSMDVISSRFLPAFIPKDGWRALLLECHRVLKRDGYLELTILDPVLNDMGPLIRSWVFDDVLADRAHPRAFDIMPTKTVLAALEEAGFEDIRKVWMWMPAVSAGDELSTVTSCVGKFLYDELYAPRPAGEERGGGVRRHVESWVWRDPRIVEECRKSNTAFRWLKVYVRKSLGGGEK